MADIKKIIKDLAGSFSKDNEAQMKGVQLLKGLATSDDPLSNKFMKKLDKATTEISKELTKEESVIVVQEDTQIGDVILEVGDRIRILGERYDETILKSNSSR